MKKQIKILLTAGMIVTPAFLTSIIPLPGISIQVYANTTETFDKVEKDIIDKSKEVIKKETEAWKKELKSDVKTTIESICKESDFKTITKINTELRQGDEAKSKDTIEKLDAALRAAPVTKEGTKVYIDVSLKNDFGVSKDNVKTGETVITENGYIKGSLVRNTSALTSEVIELTIPKGEHMANMTPSGSSTLSYNELLERGHSFIITAKKEIKDMGKTRTKIEAELLPKDFVKENKREKEVPAQQKLEDPFIQLDIQGKDTEVAYQEAQNIANRIGKIDPGLLNILKEKGAMLTLVDYPITDVAGFEHLKNVVPPGWEGATDAAGNQLTWNDVPSLQNKELKLAVVRIGYSEKGKGHSSINLELNTIAKLLDREVLGSPSMYSHAFASIHAAEQESFLSAGTYKNKEEYFAEAFAYYYLDEQSKTELKEKAPYTYAYIEDVLRKINIEPKQFEKELNEMLNLNRFFISFDVKNNTTVLEYEEAQRFINNIGKVDKEILNNLVDKGASLKIINYPLTEIPEYSYLKGKLISTTNEGVQLNWDECYGLTPPSIQNPIVVRMGYRDHTSSVNAELHEIGHAVDNFVVPGISMEEGFRKPFEKEQEKFLPNSYYKDPKEYFAECFAYYYLDEQSKQQLKDEAPETYAYVEFLINVIKEALNELDSLK